MVDNVKEDIKILGFQQMVSGTTRTWKDAPDSLLDHIWMNRAARLIFYRNIVRTFSDHNLILMSYRTKDRITDKHDIVCRDRRNFKVTDYQEQIGLIDWSRLYSSDNVDEINNIFEEKLTEVLDQMAPIKVTQQRRKFRSWISDDMKSQMLHRDRLRQTAKSTGLT